MDQHKYNVVFVLGPPGFRQRHTMQENNGDVQLRAPVCGRPAAGGAATGGSKYGEMIDEHIRNGTIVPVEVTCALLENAMQASGDAAGFLIDGFPRNEDNNDGWNRQMSSKVNLQFVLFIECDQDVCLQRCLNRGQGRADDNEESLKKRIQTYLKPHYANREQLRSEELGAKSERSPRFRQGIRGYPPAFRKCYKSQRIVT